MTTDTDTLAPDHHRVISATVRPPTDPDAAADVECFMTTDSIDADNEIVLPGGADFSRFESNPVVLLCHGYGQPGSHYPLPVGKAMWWRRVKRGIIAGVKFAESTEMGREVKGLFREGMFRSFSIGFRSLESSPLTRDEAYSRPDWRAAYEANRGKILVHRRWQLLELSAVPLPANPDALTASYKARNLPVPSWLQLETPIVDDHTADDATAAEESPGGEEQETGQTEDVTKAARPDEGQCSCGKPDCSRCGTHEKAAETDDDEEDDPENDEARGFKRGDHVDIKAPHYRGPGVVKAIYKRGHVPNVSDNIRATPDEPAARVECYKAFGDGHVSTGDHVGAQCRHLRMKAEPMNPPTRKAVAEPPIAKKQKFAVDPLPPLEVLSDAEMQQQALRELSRLPELVDESIYRHLGGI